MSQSKLWTLGRLQGEVGRLNPSGEVIQILSGQIGCMVCCGGRSYEGMGCLKYDTRHYLTYASEAPGSDTGKAGGYTLSIHKSRLLNLTRGIKCHWESYMLRHLHYFNICRRC